MPTVNQEAISTHLLPTVGGLGEEAGVGQQVRGCPDLCHFSTSDRQALSRGLLAKGSSLTLSPTVIPPVPLPLGSSSMPHPQEAGEGVGADRALTWAGPGSAVWLGQATAKVPSAALGSLEGRLPAGLSVG